MASTVILVGHQYTSKVTNNYKPWKGGAGKGPWQADAPGLAAAAWRRKRKKSADVFGDGTMGTDDMGGSGVEDFTFNV